MKPSSYTLDEAQAYDLGRQHALTQFEQRLRQLEQRLHLLEIRAPFLASLPTQPATPYSSGPIFATAELATHILRREEPYP